MARWTHFLSGILLVVAAMPGGAVAWEWALQRTIPSPSPTISGFGNVGFGSSLAPFGNALLVGNPVATGGPLAGGAGYLVDPTTGAVLQTFYSPDASTCLLGTTVSSAGAAAWVGSYNGELANCRPKHFLFDPTTGAAVNTINDPIQQQNDQTFGESVAPVGANRVLTGDQYDLGLMGVGYLIDLGSPGGALVKAFTNPVPNDIANSRYFGEAVAVAGGNLVIAAPGYHVTLYDANTLALVWTRFPHGDELFGARLAADTTHVLVAAPAGPSSAEHAYLYDLGGNLTMTFTDPVPAGGASVFGSAIALTPTQVFVADASERVTGSTAFAGVVHVFDRSTGSLVQTIPNPSPSIPQFGTEMTTVGPLLIVSNTRAGSTSHRGVVYVYAPCGDGVLDPGQECDDGNNAPGDACDPNCRVPGCGNGYLDVSAGEVCDDGNLVGGDGCRADCTPEACGDGVVDPGEGCDDGDTDPGDACDPNCQPPGCGNGYLDVAAGETCDDGNVIGCPVDSASGAFVPCPDCCSSTCQLSPEGTPCAPFGVCSATGTCVGIPTLGEWGVIIGSLLMLLAVLRHRRRPA
jgi:cysteine-rich repeat protein